MSRAVVSGRYANLATRAVAVVLDAGVVLGSYAIVVAVVDVLGRAVLDVSVGRAIGLPAVVALVAWALLYLVIDVAITGRTVGKAVVGLRVLHRDGSPVRPLGALVRAVTFPLSIAFAGVGLVMILAHRRHQALHDILARTVVVYDWGDRPAQLPAPLTAYLRDHDSL